MCGDDGEREEPRAQVIQDSPRRITGLDLVCNGSSQVHGRKREKTGMGLRWAAEDEGVAPARAFLEVLHANLTLPPPTAVPGLFARD